VGILESKETRKYGEYLGENQIMTKDEQTIANLKKLKSVHNGSFGADIDRAIKTLDQQPCEDAISRRDVKKYLSAPNENGDRVIYESDLDLLPSVTPTRKKGKWVDIKKDGNRIYRCRCSECGKNPIEYTYGYEDWWFEELPKFCPDCGTEMENEDI
jgi:hypothetical protein